MSQYKIGTISITNGSASVTITSASSGAENVAVGDSFKVDRDGEAIYLLASRTPSSGASLTAVTLTTTYGGTTGSGLGYQITTDYTPNRSYPELSQGDADAADWITRTLRKIDQDMALLLGTGSALAISNNQVGFWSSGLTGSPNLTWNGTSFAIGTAGPHAIGGATSATQQLTQTGSFTGNIGTRLSTTLAVAASADGYGLFLDPVLTEAASGNHPVLAGLGVNPTFASGLASVTVMAGISLSTFTAPASTTTAAGLYIANGPSGATNNYALLVQSGNAKFGGQLIARGGGDLAGNSAFGDIALQNNTTGANNTAVGYSALLSNTTGASNTAVGLNALLSNTTGVQNTAVGLSAMAALTTGGTNVAVGHAALFNITTGSNNVGVGHEAGADAMVSLITQSNTIVMGNNLHTAAYVKVGWTIVSDARDKTEIRDIPYGLSFVKQLTPVSFRFRRARDSEEAVGDTRMGFLAQQVLALEGETPLLIDVHNPEKLKIRESSMFAVFARAVQELAARVERIEDIHRE